MPSDSQPSPLDAPVTTPEYNMAVADLAGKSLVLVRYIYADKGRVDELFTEYLNQKITNE